MAIHFDSDNLKLLNKTAKVSDKKPENTNRLANQFKYSEMITLRVKLKAEPIENIWFEKFEFDKQ